MQQLPNLRIVNLRRDDRDEGDVENPWNKLMAIWYDKTDQKRLSIRPINPTKYKPYYDVVRPSEGAPDGDGATVYRAVQMASRVLSASVRLP